MVLNPTSVIIVPEVAVESLFNAQFYLSMGMQLKIQSEFGDVAQIAKTWGMQLKVKGTITTPFSLYVLTLFAHSCDLTLMVQHNESRGGKC